MNMFKKIAVLIACHNRKQKTISCLERLFQQECPCKFEIYLCDDDSNDGTSDAVKQLYPSVHIVKGNGNLFWGRGMITAWKEALKSKDVEAFLWLNDDVFLNNDAVETMLNAYGMAGQDCIIAGEFCAPSGAFSYGARDELSRPILPNGCLQKAFYLNGNFVLVSQKTVSKIGILDWSYIHHNGDFEYGLRARNAGIPIFTTPIYVGVCEPNKVMTNRRRKANVSIFRRFKVLYSPLGSNPIVFFKYRKKYFGIFSAIRDFVSVHVINILPDCLYAKIKKR